MKELMKWILLIAVFFIIGHFIGGAILKSILMISLSGNSGDYDDINNTFDEATMKHSKFLKLNRAFVGKLNESSNILVDIDGESSRKSINETKLLLVNTTQKIKVICNWYVSNGYPEESMVACRSIEIYELCYPRHLDNFYTFTYVFDSAKKNQYIDESKNEDAIFCNQWLSEYNTVRRICNPLFEKAELNYALKDRSSICDVFR